MIAFVLVVSFMIVEAVAGWLTHSLALISDAGHMATDALGLGMALAAITAASNATRSPDRTYGLYRTEILAALANAVLLFAIAGYVLYEAVQRLGDPAEVIAGPMVIVAIGGLAVNLIGWRLLRGGSKESLNVEGAYVEVIADLIGSVGVIVAAATIQITGWTLVDPIIGAGIAVFILPRAWRLAKKAIRILIQAAPEHIDVEGLAAKLLLIPGVTDVHDLHVWTLSSDMDVATVHLRTSDGSDARPVLSDARNILRAQGLTHATMQVETESLKECSEMAW